MRIRGFVCVVLGAICVVSEVGSAGPPVAGRTPERRVVSYFSEMKPLARSTKAGTKHVAQRTFTVAELTKLAVSTPKLPSKFKKGPPVAVVGAVTALLDAGAPGWTGPGMSLALIGEDVSTWRAPWHDKTAVGDPLTIPPSINLRDGGKLKVVFAGMHNRCLACHFSLHVDWSQSTKSNGAEFPGRVLEPGDWDLVVYRWPQDDNPYLGPLPESGAVELELVKGSIWISSVEVHAWTVDPATWSSRGRQTFQPPSVTTSRKEYREWDLPRLAGLLVFWLAF